MMKTHSHYRSKFLATFTLLSLLIIGQRAEATHPHETASCKKCHLGAAAQATPDRDVSSASNTCLSCHRSILSAGSSVFHGPRRSCTPCHTYHEPDRINTVTGTLSLSGARLAGRHHCDSCHDNGALADLSEAHLAAGSLYHEHAADLQELSPSDACLLCHDNAKKTAWQAAHSGEQWTFSTHATHPLGVEVRPGQGPIVRRMRSDIDPRIPRPAGRIECQSCHQLTARTTDRLHAFAQPKDLCLGCHQLKDKPADSRHFVATAGLR